MIKLLYQTVGMRGAALHITDGTADAALAIMAVAARAAGHLMEGGRI